VDGVEVVVVVVDGVEVVVVVWTESNSHITRYLSNDPQ